VKAYDKKTLNWFNQTYALGLIRIESVRAEYTGATRKMPGTLEQTGQKLSFCLGTI